MTGPTSPNFSAQELSCRCCGVNGMKPVFVEMLQELRNLYAKPMIVTSAFRCLKHNQAVKGSANSQHLLGLAADIQCLTSQDRFRMINIALSLGFTGIGVDKAFLHLDFRAGPKMFFLY